MKLKKLSHVLIFCFSMILLFWGVGSGLYYSLVITICSGKPAALLYFSIGIKNFMVALIGVLILKMLGKTNILKDKGKGFWRGIFIGSFPFFCITFYIVSNILAAADIRLQSWEVIMSIIFQCFSVGVTEEIYFRGIIFNVIDDYFEHKNARGVWKTVVLSGFLFGFFHLSIFGGMSGFLSTLSQSIVCIGVGIFWGAVYMRCRNIYSLMFIHALHDIVAAYHTFIVSNNFAESGASQGFDWISTIIQLIVFILPAMFILRKKKMKEIIDCDPNKSSLKIKV